jgi:hypothetical protein
MLERVMSVILGITVVGTNGTYCSLDVKLFEPPRFHAVTVAVYGVPVTPVKKILYEEPVK